MYQQPRRDLDLCENSFTHYSEKCFTEIYRALYGDAMLAPTNMGTNMVAVKVTETSVIEFCHRSEKLLLYSSSKVRTV